ncbi:MAG: four-carbon acid sugar kinase family protein [Desulfobacteraceae bacterium]|nr:MAG: four-carbon acid sugar kinase family protein [Desulfobacteraceae bacterium]
MAGKHPHSDGEPRLAFTEISMIADDLAGACDTGYEFLDALGCVSVLVDSDAADEGCQPAEGLRVYNTESRGLPPDAAYGKAYRAARIAGRGGQRVLVKKTDSAFRGQFGREIAAVMDAFETRLCCVAPAIPDFGRTTRNGFQYIDGVPIAETFYGKDPKNPISTSEVALHAAAENDRPVGRIDLKTLRSKENAQRLARLISSGSQVLVVDGETRQDLDTAARLFLMRPERVLFVGGQGIGNALAGFCDSTGKKDGWTKVPEGPVLVVCGTLHPRSREQLARISKAHRLDSVHIRPEDPLSIDAASEKAASQLLEQMKQCGIGALCTPEDAVYEPGLVEKAISRSVRLVSDRIRLSGLLLTGGSTGYETCRAIGIRRLCLRERISPGTVIAQAPPSGMAVLIKGGSLGEPDAFLRFVETVKNV